MRQSEDAMKICILAPNFAPEIIGCGKYTTDISQVLYLDGNEITVVTGNPHYPNINDFQKLEKYSDKKFEFEIIRVVNNLGSYKGLLGRLHDAISYGLGVYRYFRTQDVSKIDKVIIIAPYIFTVFCVGKLRKFRIPVDLHIQDNEILYLENQIKLFSFISFFIKKFIFSRISNVSTISNNMAKIINEYLPKGNVKVIRNWADNFDVRTFNKRSKDFIVRYPKLHEDISGSKKVVLYSGNIGQKQGLDIFLNAVDILKKKNAVLIFVGDGSGLIDLKKKFSAYPDLVSFHPFVDVMYLDVLLRSADIAVVPQLQEVEDLVFPSKLNNLLANNIKVLVGCSPGTELFDLQTYNGMQMYWTYFPEDIGDFKQMLSLVLDDNNYINANDLVQNELNMEINVRKFLD